MRSPCFTDCAGGEWHPVVAEEMVRGLRADYGLDLARLMSRGPLEVMRRIADTVTRPVGGALLFAAIEAEAESRNIDAEQFMRLMLDPGGHRIGAAFEAVTLAIGIAFAHTRTGRLIVQNLPKLIREANHARN